MSFWPVPDVMKESIYEITPRMFTNRQIRLIILDVDNTIAPYSLNEATPRMKAWTDSLKEAGLELFILSNNRGERPEIFSRELGIEYVKRAWKPFTKTAKSVLSEKGFTPGETAFVGDQIYADVLCAKSLGAFAVLVHPIAFSNIFLRIRYWLELPFRLKYKWRHKK